MRRGERERRRRRAGCRRAARTARTSSDVACGRNEKIPPPSLSTTTIRRSASRVIEADEGVAVVHERQVADQHDRRRAPSSARPSAVDTTPSMPLAPRLAWARARRTAEPLEIADRHRRGDRRARRRPAGASATSAGDTRLGEFGRTRRAPPRSPRCGDRLGVEPPVSHTDRGSGATAAREDVVDRTDGGDVVVGVDHARARRPGRLRRAVARAPLGEHLRAGRSADPHDHVGNVRGDERLVTQDGVGRRRRRPAR